MTFDLDSIANLIINKWEGRITDISKHLKTGEASSFHHPFLRSYLRAKKPRREYWVKEEMRTLGEN